MRIALVLLVLFISLAAAAQDISGKWKGYFTQSDFRQFQQRYNIEVEFTLLPSNLIKITTSTYKGKILISKAEGTGIYNKRNNYILFSQTKLTDIHPDKDNEPCYLAFNLSYSRHGRETLTGICKGRTENYSPCGEGKVYLRRFLSSEERTELREERKDKRLQRKSKRQAAKGQ